MISDANNEGTDKICAACRKRIDLAALICPHCRSDTNYRTLINVSNDLIIKDRRPIRSFVSFLVSVLVAAVFGLYAFLLFGFLAGAGAVIIVFTIMVSLMMWISGARGFDKLSLSCPECGHQASYQWPEGSLGSGKNGDLVCAGCNLRLRVNIGL
jgi:predicted RNA-binding Zn-ribbon protein involved in translation (DUF1610 family)